MRTPDLEPVKVEGRKRPWRLNVPASMAQDGKRQQLFFETKDDAGHHALTLQFGQKSFGDLIYKLKPHQLAECVKAYELLEPVGVGILDAVNGFLADHARRTASKSLGACFDAYTALRERSQDYAKELAHTRKAIESLLDRPIVDIDAGEIEKCLQGIAVSTRDARIRRLRSVWAHAIRKGWTTVSIPDRLDIIGTRHDEVRIYHTGDVERMLKAALEHDRELLPFLALCAFCGLRPEREAFHLDWADVHLTGKNPQVVVKPELSKVRRRRFVDIPKVATTWIKASGVVLEGRVCPFSFTTLVRKRRDNREKANVELIPDGLRHSYCSAFLGNGGEITKLLLATGHTNASTTFRHYHRVMTEAEARKYWGLRPNG